MLNDLWILPSNLALGEARHAIVQVWWSLWLFKCCAILTTIIDMILCHSLTSYYSSVFVAAGRLWGGRTLRIQVDSQVSIPVPLGKWQEISETAWTGLNLRVSRKKIRKSSTVLNLFAESCGQSCSPPRRGFIYRDATGPKWFIRTNLRRLLQGYSPYDDRGSQKGHHLA
jgi:hypothetical protein